MNKKMPKTRLVVLALIVYFGSCTGDQFTASSRSERFLSLFSVVRFKNSMCTGDGGLFGTCYTPKQCTKNGGNTYGSCADGFGACCVTRLGCGSRSSNNCTYIESPNYPSSFNSAMTCTQKIVLNADACQVRLDVREVRLALPNSNGFCRNDVLTFSQDIKWKQVCGITEDTHFYLDVDPSVSSTLDFTFVTDNSNFDRRWRIKVSQICCDQLSMAPSGCGQYFTSTTGTIRGWSSQSGDLTYLAGQNYAICMRKEINRCSTTYLDNNPDSIFIPRCTDTLEWPYNLLSGAGNFFPPCGIAGPFYPPMPITIPLQGANYLYFVTQETDMLRNCCGNINMDFTQNAC